MSSAVCSGPEDQISEKPTVIYPPPYFRNADFLSSLYSNELVIIIYE